MENPHSVLPPLVAEQPGMYLAAAARVLDAADLAFRTLVQLEVRRRAAAGRSDQQIAEELREVFESKGSDGTSLVFTAQTVEGIRTDPAPIESWDDGPSASLLAIISVIADEIEAVGDHYDNPSFRLRHELRYYKNPSRRNPEGEGRWTREDDLRPPSGRD